MNSVVVKSLNPKFEVIGKSGGYHVDVREFGMLDKK